MPTVGCLLKPLTTALRSFPTPFALKSAAERKTSRGRSRACDYLCHRPLACLLNSTGQGSSVIKRKRPTRPRQTSVQKSLRSEGQRPRKSPCTVPNKLTLGSVWTILHVWQADCDRLQGCLDGQCEAREGQGLPGCLPRQKFTTRCRCLQGTTWQQSASNFWIRFHSRGHGPRSRHRSSQSAQHRVA